MLKHDAAFKHAIAEKVVRGVNIVLLLKITFFFVKHLCRMIHSCAIMQIVKDGQDHVKKAHTKRRL